MQCCCDQRVSHVLQVCGLVAKVAQVSVIGRPSGASFWRNIPPVASDRKRSPQCSPQQVLGRSFHLCALHHVDMWLMHRCSEEKRSTQSNQSQSHSAIVLQPDCCSLLQYTYSGQNPATILHFLTLHKRYYSWSAAAFLKLVVVVVVVSLLYGPPSPSYNVQALRGSCLSRRSV